MERDADDKETYRAKSWKPVEASLVSIPADMTVGVGRSGKAENKPVIKTSLKERNIMSEVNIEAVKAEAQQAAQKNAAQIVELGARHNKSDMARDAIAKGQSIDSFRGELLESIGSTNALESQDIGMNTKEVRNFSMMRAIHALANPTDRRAQEAAAFEFECSNEAARMQGKSAQGIMMPGDLLRSWGQRDLNTTDDASLIAEDYRGGDFIDVLRNKSSVMNAGATILRNLQGNVVIPKKTAASSAAWIATEGGNSGESEFSVGSVTMSPKVIGGHTEMTRLMLQQSSLDVENLVRNDLSEAIALAIDLGALAGSGSSGQPTGISATSGINTTTFAAAIPTFAELVAMESAVSADNALQGSLKYIAKPSDWGTLKSVDKASGFGQMIVGSDGQINGYDVVRSNQVTAGDYYFGNFADLLIGLYGSLDITVDPYTHSKSGTIRVVALQTCDVAVRHAVSFCKSNDS
jgi:HK97 family phage major capsid protein